MYMHSLNILMYVCICICVYLYVCVHLYVWFRVFFLCCVVDRPSLCLVMTYDSHHVVVSHLGMSLRAGRAAQVLSMIERTMEYIVQLYGCRQVTDTSTRTTTTERSQQTHEYNII